MIDLADVVLADGDHVVQFYERDDTLTAAVAGFLGEGLAGAAGTLVVATPEHRAAFEAALTASGVDVASARRDGRYTDLDAATTLTSLLVDGHPDPARFESVIGTLVAAYDGPLRIYGELVALLWERGAVDDAITLEGLWNALARDRVFTLFCGYPAAVHADERRALCAHHTSVVPDPAPPEPSDGEAARRFEPTPYAVPTARAFVAETLRAWGLTDADDAARLVVTELVTNAVKHTRGRCLVTLTRHDGNVRVAVTDTSPHLPSPRPEDPAIATGGRGIHLVASLSVAWGTTTHHGGKTVWADLAA